LNGSGQAVALYTERVNRQQLQPTFIETGGVIGTRIRDLLATGTRVNEPVVLLTLDEIEGLDIDSDSDLLLADLHARRLRIAIRADASPLLGMGHIYRAIALTQAMPEHDVYVVTRACGDYQLGPRFLKAHPCRVCEIATEEDFFSTLASLRPDIVILDVLDTTEDYVDRVAACGAVTVSLEDLGPGARRADIVINDLYTDLYPQENHWYGVQNAILAPHFESVTARPDAALQVNNILITFGGTDPGNLTAKALAAVGEVEGYDGAVTVVLGPGYSHPEPDLAHFGLRGKVLRSVSNMALTMREADMAVTSAGRTVTELMTLGIPVIALCQNVRELRHTHASSPYGVINLGLGEHVTVSALSSHISMLVGNPQLRSDMRARALAATRGRSNRDIAQRILTAAATRRR
jgi:spore coat polysaccharide biosynthesis predicted glycosyltransferase SpsG